MDAGAVAVGVDAERIRELRETYEELQEVVQLASEFSASELREALESYDR